ncbi:hypothetical protein LDENG_00050380 [Lucifuga dentata]|nr:hypothetical protein LDENG_00050380 [Lucifuga dentata]
MTILDTYAADASLPDAENEVEHYQMETQEEKEKEQQRFDLIKQEAGRGRRGTWGKRQHAATAEATAYRLVGLGHPLPGWRRRGKEEEEASALMAVLKELHADKNRLMDQGKTKEEEEEDDDDDDDEEE